MLVVDDDLSVAKAIARLLRRDGYDVRCVDSADRALEILVEDHAFECVISDIQMPGRSGVDLLREVGEQALPVPVILMTGAPRIETAAAAVEHGALCYLVKPVDPAALDRALVKAAERQRLLTVQRRTLAEHHEGAGEHLSKLSASFSRTMLGLWMAYQPILNASTGAVFGYEALLRSREPALPHPGAVLEAAERLDRLDELGRRVRLLSARDATKAGADQLLFVNLHARDLFDPCLLDPASPLTRVASSVVLEVTERAALGDITAIRDRIRQLRVLGFRIAVDDLGAGYAGLTSFAQLEPEFIKLDMSLVRDVDQSPIKQKLIGSITSLCADMGVQVVAEGIETTAELDVLLGLQCDLLQGFLFARPEPPFADAKLPAGYWAPGAPTE